MELLSEAGKCIPRSNTPHDCPNHEAQGNFLVVLMMAGPTRAFRVNFRVHWLWWMQTKKATERSSLVYLVKTLTRDAEVLVKAQGGLRQATRNEVLPRSGLLPLVPASAVTASTPPGSCITIVPKTSSQYSYSKRRLLRARGLPIAVRLVHHSL